MNRSLCSKFAQYQDIDCTVKSVIIDPDYEVDSSNLKSVLEEIFSVDPVTGAPRGDIQYFLSKDGNPQIKAWLESNLLSPRSKYTGSSIVGLTDDFISEYARQDGESVSDYSRRLRSYYDSALAEQERLKSES